MPIVNVDELIRLQRKTEDVRNVRLLFFFSLPLPRRNKKKMLPIDLH